MTTMGIKPMEEIISKVDRFGLIRQQNIIKNKFNYEYALLATIQQGAPIKFINEGTNDLYLDLKNSRLHMLAKITNANGTNIAENTAAPINLPLHSMVGDIFVKLNSQIVGEMKPFYPY